MSCQEELAYTQQVIGQVRQGLAAQQSSLIVLRAQVAMLRAAQGSSAPSSVTSLPTDATGDNAITVETRPGAGLASEAALHRDLTDMEQRLDRLEAR